MTTDIIDTKASTQTKTVQSRLAAPVQSTSSPTASPPSPSRKPRKLICLKEVAYRLSISRATVYRLKDRSLAGKGTFPLPVEIGPGRIGWHEHEIDAWLDSLPRIKGPSSKHGQK